MIPKFRCFIDGIGIVGVKAIYFDSEQIILEPFNGVENQYIALEEVELLQSTGLKDKHGVEIYDKDIVRDSYGDILLIEWLDGGFVLTDFFSGGYDHCEIDDLESYEVIGNQFQHPHLLEE